MNKNFELFLVALILAVTVFIAVESIKVLPASTFSTVWMPEGYDQPQLSQLIEETLAR